MYPSAVRPARAGSEDPAYSSDPSASDARVILFVTGDADLREAAARALVREGFRVLPAAHAGHAVLACLQVDRVDAAVVELSMADVSGPALVERLRRKNPGMRAVYLGHPGTRECAGVLVRPFTRDDLLAELAFALTPKA
jgi:DNA-binding response OmpR family regulator